MKQADMCVRNDIAGMPAACSRGGASRRPMPVRPGCTSLHARHRNGIATASQRHRNGIATASQRHRTIVRRTPACPHRRTDMILSNCDFAFCGFP
ncbi:hypothetical protein [Burkholderia plantarii]|uniref:hypothetical protein n=1 Tax=Burkholderia plantarii TaxID=41899 RepID=UPI000F4DD265|nr:hypothetical protein [Burkholderia plantarii]